jgi:hypothetical protein
MRSVTCFSRIRGAQGNFHSKGEMQVRLSKNAQRTAKNAIPGQSSVKDEKIIQK